MTEAPRLLRRRDTISQGNQREPITAVVLRVAILAVLAAAPLAFGAVTPEAYRPLLAVFAVTGVVSWVRGHRARSLGQHVALVPGRRLLLALHALVLLQLQPLPYPVLAHVSPGTIEHHAYFTPHVDRDWAPVSVSPSDTRRGLLFLAGMTLLYATVVREFAARAWRRRLAATLIATGALITLIGFVQAASSNPRAIYGSVQPGNDWAVFGPYVNRNHFAGYLVMVIPMALGFAAEAFRGFREDWSLRRPAWLALAGRAGNQLLRRGALTMFLIAGILASGSRSGLAIVPACLSMVLGSRHRARAVLLMLLLILVGGLWIDWDPIVRGFRERGMSGRFDLWAEMSEMVPGFLWLGAGFNAFARAFAPFQTQHTYAYANAAHNEYFQALLDTGLVGVTIVVVLLALLFGAALRNASRGPFHAGVLGGIAGSALTAVVDFNWQIPANCAAFVALAGLALTEARDPHP